MFSFLARKPSKKASSPPTIRPSPSLPELSAKGIPWPEHLVDVSALPEPEPEPQRENGARTTGATRTSFRTDDGTPIPFHVPWSSPGRPTDAARGSISSMYMSHPPSAFETRKQSYPRVRPSQRRARIPATFNVMVVGAQGTGKTSLLRLLLDTADISPTATPEQKTAVERFLRGPPRRTESIQAACVEICESRYDRILLSVIDTPGLDFVDGHELKLERQVTSIVKYLDTQFSDTLNEESKVVRQSKGDQHVHLCIYMIDPASISTAAARRAQSSLPTKNRSEATVYHPQDLSSISDGSSEADTEDERDGELTMSPADIRVMQRLMARANVLPVIARADSLTDETLAMVKETIRRDMRAANIDFGVFGPIPPSNDEPAGPSRKVSTNGAVKASDEDAQNRHANGHAHANGDDDHDRDQSDSDEPAEERRSRSVIKLRPSRAPKLSRSKSRSRLELTEAANEPAMVDLTDTESVASVRFSAHIIVKHDLTEFLPFALIAPENVHRRRALKSSPSSANRHSLHTDAGASEMSHSEDAAGSAAAESAPSSPSTILNRNFAYLSGPPADLRGIFTRKFRWGTIDVLAPEHCDFAALRTAVLSTHMKMLKIRTREVLYEKYRTEKLLARRATRNINEEQTRQLLKDLGL